MFKMSPRLMLTAAVGVAAVAVLGGAGLLLHARPVSAAAGPRPDVIFVNGKVVTLDARSSIAQAIAVKDGKVIAVGSAADIRRLGGPGVETVDLGGRTLVPGLSDSHVHVTGLGSGSFVDAQIGDVSTVGEILDIIGAAAKLKKPGEWITVSGDMRHNRLREQRRPTKAELDRVAPNNPVLVPMGHLSTANSLALKLAGVTRATPNPQGGLIGHDASGEPDGTLEERASGLVSRLIPPREIDHRSAILAAQKRLLALGFTSVREPGTSLDFWRTYKALNAEKQLQIRYSILLRARDDADLPAFAAELPYKDDMLSVWGIKLGIDGGLVLTNAGMMHEPYLDKPGYAGVQTTPTPQFNKTVSEANKLGLAVAVHSTGDKGIETTLEAFQKASAEKSIVGRRFAVEHADLPTPRAMAMMKEMGVVASVQPSMLTTAPAVLLDQLGPARMAYFLPYQSYKRAGIVMAGGSDASAFDLNPYRGIWSVVTRRVRSANQVPAPEQRLTREEALRIYVQGGAYLTSQENVKGSIEPGKFADFTVLDADIMTVEEDKIGDILPVMTIVGGKIVYRAPTT
jgi:predicted amidohydrolase YtcJ